MRNYYATPVDAIKPIAAALEAAQYLFNDEYGKDLAHDLIAWAQETAVRATPPPVFTDRRIKQNSPGTEQR